MQLSIMFISKAITVKQSHSCYDKAAYLSHATELTIYWKQLQIEADATGQREYLLFTNSQLSSVAQW